MERVVRAIGVPTYHWLHSVGGADPGAQGSSLLWKRDNESGDRPLLPPLAI
jgi:hypothetical protein